MAAQQKIPTSIYLLLGLRFLAGAVTVGLTTMVGKQVFDITGNAFDLGLLGLAEFIPTALMAPIAGPLSDRFDRRYLISGGLAVNAVAAAGLSLYAATSPTSIAPIIALVMLLGLGQGFLFGSLRSMPVDLSPKEILPRVMALSGTSRLAGNIVGPVIAGFLYVIAVPVPFLFSTIGLVCGSAVTWLLPKTTVDKTDHIAGLKATFRSAGEGLRFIRKSPLVLGAMSLDLFAVLLGGAVALLPAIAEDRLGVGAVGLGWLRAALGIGAASMTLLLVWKPLRRNIGYLFFGAVAVFGLTTVGIGLTKSYAVVFVLLFVLAAADGVSVVVRSTLMPLATPENMRGRVASVESIFIGGSNELGAFQSGVAASLLGLAGAVIFGGVGTVAVVGAWWFLFPALRNIDRFDDV